MKAGARVSRVQVSGRLGGAEMSRTEFYREGRVPLHVACGYQYGFYEARTTFIFIGVKVWVYGRGLGKHRGASGAAGRPRRSRRRWPPWWPRSR